jgi:hypothetical protein
MYATWFSQAIPEGISRARFTSEAIGKDLSGTFGT